MISSEARAGDGSIEDPKHDDFQRARFAKRIAETFISRTEVSSIVIGLYGKWGEGKSTVLNFIRRTLTASDKVLVVSFNPWRFPDEAQLLHNFFAQMAQQIDDAVIPVQPPKSRLSGLFAKADKPLQTRKESLSQLFTEYAGSLSFAGINLGKVVGAAVPIPNLDKLRKRVEEKIAAAGKRIVVIVDDIDRLEKNQIQAVFRLIKLTADFKNTAYLLAFDELMVARVLGEVYSPSVEATGSATLAAGQNFLEKIIQVQLRLPQAGQQALLDYCAARVGEALNDTETELDSERERVTGKDKNWQRFGDALRRGILPRLNTPRQAIRYANAIRFSLPLLRGEADQVDLMLIEALSIFYPELHQFVNLRQDDFVGSEQGRVPLTNLGGEEEEEGLDKQLDKLFTKHYYTIESRRGARMLLNALFPRVAGQSTFWAGYSDSDNGTSEAQLNLQQSIAAPAYFSRYFSYSVANGDVADQEWATLFTAPVVGQHAIIRDFINRLGVAVVLQKIDYRVPELTADQSRNLWFSLLKAGELYRPEAEWATFGRGDISQAAQLLVSLLGNIPEQAERRELINTGIREEGTFSLVYELDQQLQQQHQQENQTDVFNNHSSKLRPLFSTEEWNTVLGELPQLLLNRALREAGSIPLYKALPQHAAKLLLFIWPRVTDKSEVAAYVLRFLHENPQDLFEFLKVSSERITMGPDSHWGGLPKPRIEQLIEIFGNQLYPIARQLFGDSAVRGVDFQEYEEPTDKQRLQQFIFWYERLTIESPLSE